MTNFNKLLRTESFPKIYFDGMSSNDRIQISDGILKADFEWDMYGDRKYAKNSFVPTKPWNSLNLLSENPFISSTSVLNYKRNVALLTIPDELRKLFTEINLGSLNNITEAKQRIQLYPELFQCINESLTDFVKTVSTSKERSPEILGIFFMKPGLRTLGTRDNEFIGLHLDNGFATHIDKMESAPNRLCINLGMEDRSFLFIPKAATEMLEEVRKIKQIDTRSYKEMHLVADYLEHALNLPVLKVKQRPFEAYIAPTDHIIHDGCTENMTHTDVTLVLTGEFGLNGDSIN